MELEAFVVPSTGFVDVIFGNRTRFDKVTSAVKLNEIANGGDVRCRAISKRKQSYGGDNNVVPNWNDWTN